MSWNNITPAWLIDAAKEKPVTRYVAGFAFEGNTVALIEKQRPDWQKGRLNGIGGHIEPGETTVQAMVREFEEETGRGTSESEWMPFAVLTGDGFEVTFFRSFQAFLEELRSMTDEKVIVTSAKSVNVFNAIPNLTWLIPMAQSMPYDRTEVFQIMETYGQG